MWHHCTNKSSVTLCKSPYFAVQNVIKKMNDLEQSGKEKLQLLFSHSKPFVFSSFSGKYSSRISSPKFSNV